MAGPAIRMRQAAGAAARPLASPLAHFGRRVNCLLQETKPIKHTQSNKHQKANPGRFTSGGLFTYKPCNYMTPQGHTFDR